ncbi:hypothetical protein NITMOv2_2951 [Nitrospira moscoviensis]|uniref:Uncharacterized protein n=1 Tax=Nitrospira moscoviensis TaxID=42253 RepID=A0A0K2GEH5_NITMO|nr:hypothetical protein NITMOv2_2951 [Nitrospira moscoviensis]
MLTSPPDGFLDDVGGLAGPDKRCRILVPAVDVALDVFHEGPDCVEGSPANGFPGQDAEPGLHHVQPRCPGRREVEVHARVRLQPRLYLRGLVRGRVVEDDMQGALPIMPAEHVQEPKEVGPGVSFAALADDRSGSDFQSGVQTGQSIALVVMSLPGRKARAERQNRLRPVQSLDLGLLVDAQDDGVGRRVQVEADHIVDLLFGVGIRAELERLDPMGLQVVSLPYPVDRAVRHPDLSGQLAGAPMSQTIPRWLQSFGNNLGPLAGGDGRRTSRSRFVPEARDPFFNETSSEATDLDNRVARHPRHLCAEDLVSQQQHHVSPPADSGRHAGGSLKAFEFDTVGFPENDRTRMVGHAPSRDRVYPDGMLT